MAQVFGRRDAEPAPLLVDRATRTWWKRGAPHSETLVETVADRASDLAITRRVAALAAASLPAGTLRPDRVPGTADPAFAELLLVELLRAGSWDRAFAQLAPECQRAWGTPASLEAANAALGRSLAGARVASVNALDRWEDEERGIAWEGVAELVVEYALRTRQGLRAVRRVVHLVDVDGRWRSVLFPPRPEV
jgi:hypothetical protein